MIITHHDAWDFLYGMKEACSKKLKEHNIGHYYNHLPLDDCGFGTNEKLSKALGLDIIKKDFEYEGFYCGRMCEYTDLITYDELIGRVEKILNEPIKAWTFQDRKIKKVGIVCGGGDDTFLLKKAFENDCDVYITGEKTLYTLQYSQFVKSKIKKLKKLALTSECYITSSNAIAKTGELVNIDHSGNRVAAMTYGPEKVIVIVTKNKIVENEKTAIERALKTATPQNAIRAKMASPCSQNRPCSECTQDVRVCNYLSIIRGQNEKNRMIVLLLDEELGF